MPPGYGAPGHGAAGQGTAGYGSAGLPPYGSGNPYAPQQPGYGPPYGPPVGPDDPLVSANYAGWWDRSLALLRSSWQPMAMVQLIWALPLVAVGVLVNLYSAGTGPGSTTTSVNSASDILVAVVLGFTFALIAVLVALVTQLATVQVAVQRVTGQPVSVGSALLTGLRRAPAMLGWGILAGLVILVGLVFCILPGIYAYAVLMVLPVIVLLERGRGIGRAFQLFHADFGTAAARVATIIGIAIALGMVDYVFTAGLTTAGTISGDGPGLGFAVIAAVISAAISIVNTIVSSPLLLTAYADMRARHEPFSTAYLAQPAQ